MKRGTILVPSEMIVDALHLPRGTKLVEIATEGKGEAGLVKLTLEHESFPDRNSPSPASVELVRIDARYKLLAQ